MKLAVLWVRLILEGAVGVLIVPGALAGIVKASISFETYPAYRAGEILGSCIGLVLGIFLLKDAFRIRKRLMH
ncbi:MAG: hypothetical protein WCB58_18610 [Acidobacteriaceae bacterium]